MNKNKFYLSKVVRPTINKINNLIFFVLIFLINLLNLKKIEIKINKTLYEFGLLYQNKSV